MLCQLSIHQFALVEHLDIELHQGMSVISGETGAGKSILLDALGLTLGERADASFVRKGADKAEVAASFYSNSAAQAWLNEHDLPLDDEYIILRRVLTSEGRSRAYINNRPVAASDLRELGQHLIEVHSQHAHQRLLQKETPRQLLDAYAQLQPLASQVSSLWQQWQSQAKQLESLQSLSAEAQAQKQLLSYQVSELQELALGEHELEELELEQKRLSNAESMLFNSQSALSACQGDERSEQAASQLLYLAIQRLQDIDDQQPLLNEAREMLEQAQIQIDEACSSLNRYLGQIDINPHRLQQVESRLSDIFNMARKHKIAAEQLYAHWQQQEAQLAQLSLSDDDLGLLEQQVNKLHQQFEQQAQALSQARRQAALKLSQEVSNHFEALALGKAKFTTLVENTTQANRHGLDQVQFMVQTNPGMPEGPLAKVASGGELARISLAIQVVTAAVSHIPCLVFDEVDVGIGGGTAERVGRLLRNLGDHGQVFCITHQPQVAAQAHQHYQVSKISGDSATHTQLRKLEGHQRQEEIARMLGGVSITQQTLAHAQEMLQLALG
ncbi:MAG: DNA repair protein RecN [Venatoribacter sp.]